MFVMHGDDDQIVPIADSALLSVKLLKKGTLKVYPGTAARHVHDPCGHGQSRSARVLEILICAREALPERLRPLRA